MVDHGWAAWGPVARPLGQLAAGLGRPIEAAAHFSDAAELARGAGAPAWELRALGDWVVSGTAGAEREGVVARALELAAALELPWVAEGLAERAAAQQTTP